MPLQVGQQINNRYRVGAPLGEGGTASVWTVHDLISGTSLALKLLSAPQDTASRRMEREGRLQGQLRHPNIVEVVGELVVDAQPALLLELVDGPNLSHFLNTHVLTEPQIDALATGLFAGVQAAHKAGLVHRDLKPENVLLARRGDQIIAKIADFGLVKHISTAESGEPALTRTGSAMGTPSYMAPEQTRSARRADQRADLWALGCILYELVCGRQAFAGNELYDIFSRIVRGDFRPPRDLRPDAPERWLRAIEAALVVDPEQRIQRCADLAALWGRGSVAVWEASVLDNIRTPQRSTPQTIAPISNATFPTVNLPDTGLTPQTPPHEIPWEEDGLVGRQRELEVLLGHLQQHDAICITGRSGLGKTRLAIRLGWQALGAFPGGVWFCALQDAEHPADALRVIDDVCDSVTENSRCLIILDDAEIVAARFMDLRARFPRAIFLATAATSLAPSAIAYSLSPLSERDARALFCVRARAAAERADPADLAAIAQFTHGLPLAIELIAARSETIPLSDILSQLQRQADPLEAVLRWSVGLLDEAERSALAQLARFSGPITLEDAEDRLDLSAFEDEDAWAMDLVQVLVAANLLRNKERSEGQHLSLHPAVRAFSRSLR